jgi:hypothetical protein
VQLAAVGRCGAHKGETYFGLYFQHAYLCQLSEGAIQFDGRLREIYGGSNRNGVGFLSEYFGLRWSVSFRQSTTFEFIRLLYTRKEQLR